METAIKQTSNTNVISKVKYDVLVMIKPGFLPFEDEIADAFQRVSLIFFDEMEQKMTKSLAKRLFHAAN